MGAKDRLKAELQTSKSSLVIFLPHPQFGLLPPALDLPHHLRVARPFERLLFGLVEDLRVQVVAALAFRLFFFYRNPMFVGVSVMADASHLPRDLHAGPVGLDRETVAINLAGDDGLSELADDRQLVAEVAVERLEVI